MHVQQKPSYDPPHKLHADSLYVGQGLSSPRLSCKIAPQEVFENSKESLLGSVREHLTQAFIQA